MREEKRLNIAYGSNLNLKQMGHRCPSAKVYGKGILEGYRLLFKGAEDGAYLTIEKQKNSKVPVIVWELQPSDERALDFYEGFPRSYGKQEEQVTLETGETVLAMVYIMTDKVLERMDLNLPSLGYLETVQEGYEEAGFDRQYLEEALKVSKDAIEKSL